MRKLLFVLTLALPVLLPATHAAASVPLTDSVGKGQYTLQVATYADETTANAAIRELPDAWVQEVRQDGRLLYRVNYKRFSDRNAAVRAQWDLEDLGYKSFIQELYT